VLVERVVVLANSVAITNADGLKSMSMRSLDAASAMPSAVSSKPVTMSTPLPKVIVPAMAAPGVVPRDDAVAATESPPLKMTVSTAAELSVATRSAPTPASIVDFSPLTDDETMVSFPYPPRTVEPKDPELTMVSLPLSPLSIRPLVVLPVERMMSLPSPPLTDERE